MVFSLLFVLLLFCTSVHADFRNQFALLDHAQFSGATDTAKQQKYADFANHWGYPWVLGDPWSGAKALVATNSGLKVMFNSNARKGAKWYNFKNNSGAVPNTQNITDINVGYGTYKPIDEDMYAEMEIALCMTQNGVNMNFPVMWANGNFKYEVYQHEAQTILFLPNYNSQAAVNLTETWS